MLSLLDQGRIQPGSTDALTLFAFQDYARTWNQDKLPDEKAFEIASVGIGFRYQYLPYLSASFSYGWQLKDSGSSNEGDNRRMHFSLRLTL